MRFFTLILFLLTSCSNKYEVDKSILEEISCINYAAEVNSVYEYEFSKRFRTEVADSRCLEKKYDLEINFNEKSSNKIILKNSETLRENIDLLVKFKLLKNDKVIFKDQFRIINSFNTMFSPYSASTEKDVNMRDIYISAAEELRRRLIIFFEREFYRTESISKIN